METTAKVILEPEDVQRMALRMDGRTKGLFLNALITDHENLDTGALNDIGVNLSDSALAVLSAVLVQRIRYLDFEEIDRQVDQLSDSDLAKIQIPSDDPDEIGINAEIK